MPLPYVNACCPLCPCHILTHSLPRSFFHSLPFPSAALKIHVSPFTKDILDNFGVFQLELRGGVEMKVSDIL